VLLISSLQVFFTWKCAAHYASSWWAIVDGLCIMISARGLTPSCSSYLKAFKGLLILISLLLGMIRLLQYLCLVPAAVFAVRSPLVLQDSSQYQQSPTHADEKVRVQLGVMSRCPDALLCENVFNQVLEKVYEKIDLSLTYVAKCVRMSSYCQPSYGYPRIDPSEPDFGVQCMHGAEECAGNVQQLCVAKHEPTSSWWEFVQCQNYEGRDKIGIPDVTLKCARVAGIDWNTSEAGECAGLDGSGKGTEGVRLLKESVILSQKLGIK
jgi:Gamma interferon inducible lysosomal thiol reductase (GILT)